MNWRQLPNIISFLRILLAIPVIVLLSRERYFEALLLFAVAGISDALDGYLAKRNGWTSRLGTILDPLADKILLVSTYALLGWAGHLPMWLVGIVIGRDLVIVLGALAYHVLIGRYEMAPTIMSKLNTGAQIVLALAVVLSLSLVPLSDWLIEGLTLVVLITALVSGVDYVWSWGVRAANSWAGRARE